MKFSIIIVTFNRAKELIECLRSIEKQRINWNYELIIIFNGESSYQNSITQEFSHLPIKLFSINKNTPASARNYAINKSHGEYLFFLDDDCVLPEDYFSNVYFEQDWDVLGGPDQTPPDSSKWQQDIGHALTSPLCMGPTFRRHCRNGEIFSNASEMELILCNLWFKGSVFKRDGFKFNETLFRNEENFLLKELKIHNKQMVYNPNLFVYHKRKSSLIDLSKSVIKSGECRSLNFCSMPSLGELIYFLPLLMGTLIVINFKYSLIVCLAYLAGVGLYGVILANKRITNFVFMHLLILTCYLMGLSSGLCKFTLRKVSNFKFIF